MFAVSVELPFLFWSTPHVWGHQGPGVPRGRCRGASLWGWVRLPPLRRCRGPWALGGSAVVWCFTLLCGFVQEWRILQTPQLSSIYVFFFKTGKIMIRHQKLTYPSFKDPCAGHSQWMSLRLDALQVKIVEVRGRDGSEWLRTSAQPQIHWSIFGSSRQNWLKHQPNRCIAVVGYKNSRVAVEFEVARRCHCRFQSHDILLFACW